jgi:hypothetical protein
MIALMLITSMNSLHRIPMLMYAAISFIGIFRAEYPQLPHPSTFEQIFGHGGRTTSRRGASSPSTSSPAVSPELASSALPSTSSTLPFPSQSSTIVSSYAISHYNILVNRSPSLQDLPIARRTRNQLQVNPSSLQLDPDIFSWRDRMLESHVSVYPHDPINLSAPNVASAAVGLIDSLINAHAPANAPIINLPPGVRITLDLHNLISQPPSFAV